MAFGLTPRPAPAAGGYTPPPPGQAAARSAQGFAPPAAQGAPKPAPFATPATSAPAPPAGVAPGVPAPPPGADVGALGTDPAYLAYMRAIGLNDADAAAAAQQGAARINARLSNSLSDQARTNQVQNVNLGSRLEASGQGTGSMGQFDVANQAAVNAAHQEALRQAASDQLATLLTNLALTYQKGSTGAAQAGLTAAPVVAGQAAAANNYGVS